MKTVLITGANGLIGSYLCEYLSKSNFKVIALSKSFSNELKNKLNCEIIECDLIKDKIRINDEIDSVIHLATANNIMCKENFDYSVSLTLTGTKNILDFCNKKNIKEFIFFSTIQVYGTELKGNVGEDTKVNPQSYYALNHLFGEDYVKYVCKKNNINTVIARTSNVYGEFTHHGIKRWSLVPGCFCKEVFEKGTITLLSSGKQIRNFISLIEISIKCKNILEDFPENINVYNLTSKQYFKIFEIANEVKKIYDARYNKFCKINVCSKVPVKSNFFDISSRIISKYNLKFVHNNLLERCINNLFDNLEYMKKQGGDLNE